MNNNCTHTARFSGTPPCVTSMVPLCHVSHWPFAVNVSGAGMMTRVGTMAVHGTIRRAMSKAHVPDVCRLASIVKVMHTVQRHGAYDA